MPVPYHYEDLSVGTAFPLAPVAVDRAEMLAFARRFDPQGIHVDPEAARALGFDDIIASGWFTASLFMRMQCDALLLHAAGLTSPGVNELRWLRPVLAGDTLSGSWTVSEARRSSSKPDRGIVTGDVLLGNQHGDDVLTLQTSAFFLLREPS